jgi:hypothetical protein
LLEFEERVGERHAPGQPPLVVVAFVEGGAKPTW